MPPVLSVFPISPILSGINCFYIAIWVSVHLRTNNDRCVFKVRGVISGGSRGGDGLVETREFTALADQPNVQQSFFSLELVSSEKSWKIWSAVGGKAKRGKKRENTMNTKKQPQFVPINQKWQVRLCLVCILNARVFWIAKPTCNLIPFYLWSMTRLLNTHDQNELFVCGTEMVSYFSSNYHLVMICISVKEKNKTNQPIYLNVWGCSTFPV